MCWRCVGGPSLAFDHADEFSRVEESRELVDELTSALKVEHRAKAIAEVGGNALVRNSEYY